HLPGDGRVGRASHGGGELLRGARSDAGGGRIHGNGDCRRWRIGAARTSAACDSDADNRSEGDKKDTPTAKEKHPGYVHSLSPKREGNSRKLRLPENPKVIQLRTTPIHFKSAETTRWDRWLGVKRKEHSL